VNLSLALCAAALTGASGFIAAAAGYRTRRGDRIFSLIMALGCACGLVAAFRSMASIGTSVRSLPWSIPEGNFQVRLDALAGMFLAQIFLIGAAGSIYAIGYWSARKHPQTVGKLRIFYGLMVAGMALLVLADNSLLFLFGWEIMAIAGFFAVTSDDNLPAVRESGFVYFVATRLGTLLLILMFAVLRAKTGSFSLEINGLAGTSSTATAIFILGLVGFGMKAGLMPLHVWLPGAHANAPTHVSALMSGVLIKMGIYGMVRLVSLFDKIPIWWGLVLFALGIVSAVLGVAFAIGQHDLKRLLAYHSVENIGIIAMGLGLALLGRATGHPSLVALGLAGALLHTWNHGLFKALLFFSAGSVLKATQTRDLDALGGLSKKMPWTSIAFLIGAVAICGLPPLNGFVSELFVYLGMLRAGTHNLGIVGVVAMLGVPVLALVGALAVACFVKVFGVVFLGESRSSHGQSASESPWSMLAPMALLAGCCVTIGTMPLLVVPILEHAIVVFGVDPRQTGLDALLPLHPIGWLNLSLMLAVILLAFLMSRVSPGARAARVPTWDCGYSAPSPRMQYTSSSFAEGLVRMFASILRPQIRTPTLRQPFPDSSQFESHVPEVVLDLLVTPIFRLLGRIATRARVFQPGSTHLYVTYILATLLVMLFIWH
jgi:hydrogenase-4 component B